MKPLIKNFLFAIFSILLIASFTIAQTNNIACDFSPDTPKGELAAVVGGKYKPSSNAPGEYLRALIVFAQFQSDITSVPDWLKDSLPKWAYNWIDSNPSISYRNYTISDYFKRMSNGDFDFIGDIHPNIITVPINKFFGNANVDVINRLNDQIDNFSIYDN